jgi:hypothetical protein
MRIFIFFSSLFLLCGFCAAQTPALKYVVYDFDGLDQGATDLPDGDYKNFDLDYHVTTNPLTASDVLGDRVLQLDLNWSGGTGEFGKGITRYVELDAAADRFNFYFLNPLSNYAGAVADVAIKEDDNRNGIYETALDDKWVKTVTIPRSASWQLISIPLSTFTDATTGGNGIFDAGYTNDNGKIFTISLTFHQSAAATGPETYYADMICFSEGALPSGSSILNLPPKAATDHCLLGSYAYRTPADSVPPEVEAMFPAGNRLEYINIFMPYAYTGTTASALPGSSVQRLMNNGYRPIITWEMMYSAYAPLDPAQPRLINITNGSFDAYLDAFANQVKTYTDTVIIRLFHEFDGNWYSWSVEENGQDPNNLIQAYRYIVDRFNARGANNVLWMWSPNSAPAPSAAYNWFVDAYPGDAYVDIVATSVYNHPLPGVPPWRSFRSLMSECYYTLRKHFPSKPVYIAESGCRERYGGEPAGSQTKADWLCAMSKDLESYFSKTRALIFLNVNKEHDWRINSSPAALEALKTCIWQDAYFKETATGMDDVAETGSWSVFPNPFSNKLMVMIPEKVNEDDRVIMYDLAGKIILERKAEETMVISETLPPGFYIIELQQGRTSQRIKVLKQ